MHKTFTGTLLVLLLSVALSFGSGFSINEQGAKATAMGGAFIAQANDITSVFYNPAGITSLPGFQVGFGTTIIQSQFSFTGPTSQDPNLYTKSEEATFTPIHFYATYAITNNLTAGFGVYNLFGLGSEWPHGWVGRQYATTTDLKTFTINPLIAYKVMDNLSIAAGFSYIIGMVTMEKSIYTGYAADTYVESKLEANGSGYGWNVGVQWKPVDNLSIGVVYRHKAVLSFKDGDATFTIPELQNESMYQYLKAAFPNTKGSADLNLPNLLGVGISYDLTERLTAEVDYVQLGWSVYDKLTVTFEDPVAGNTESTAERNYEDSYSVRLGIEYRMDDKMSLRVGYLRDNHAVPDEYVEPSLPEGDRNLYSLGLGYKINDNLTLDAFYMYLQQEDREITTSELEINGQPAPFNGTYKGMSHLFGITLGYSF